jgi:hypothetical protein
LTSAAPLCGRLPFKLCLELDFFFLIAIVKGRGPSRTDN